MRMRRFIAVFLTVIFFVTGILIIPRQKVLAYSDEEAYWRSFSTDYYYNRLTGREKELYERLDKACMDFLLDKTEAHKDEFGSMYEIVVDITGLKISYRNTSNPDSDVYLASSVFDVFFESNPQYFFLTSYINFMYADDYYREMRLMIFQKFADRETWKQEKAKVRNALDEYLSFVPANAKPEEAEKIIHDKICENLQYIYSVGIGGDQSIYEALTKKSTICSGYALLFEALMNRLGNNCICCSGVDHRWNLIELHGIWYLVDVTNDDHNSSLKWYNCSSENYFSSPNLYHEDLAPKAPYDAFDQGRYDYSSGYIEKDGNLYFIANDINDASGLQVVLVNGIADTIPSVITHNERTYKVITNDASIITDKKDVISTDSPASTEAPVNSPTAVPTAVSVVVSSEGGTFEDFVERLYTVALNRPSESTGKEFWCLHVGNGDLNGAQCANEFLLCKEFKDRNLNDEEFLKVLYKAFFDREAANDPDGFNFWMNCLKTQGRDSVVDCFINSEEWCNVCASFGVKSGVTRAKATIASKNATDFATRLYTECLGRDPETGGLNFWSLGLTNLELTGSEAAHEFFFSKEFNDHSFDNKELLTRMYRTFMGREPDDDGMNFWLNNMKNGMTKEDVFNEFVKSKEFTEICQKYAIDRG
ncbi:MAG: DUF4214 domain-containing protein [Clostridia bacterium]|nr:DUF4214 domain-containing protein [Clostridia bacterium]